MKNTRRCALLLFLLLLMLTSVGAKPYLGVSQNLAASSVEVGFLTKGFEQNLVLSLPTVQTAAPAWLQNSALSAHLLLSLIHI